MVSFFALLTESVGNVTEEAGVGAVPGGGGVVCADAIVMQLKKSAAVVSSSFNLIFMIGDDVYVYLKITMDFLPALSFLNVCKLLQ